MLEWCEGPHWVRSGPFRMGGVGWGGRGGCAVFFFFPRSDGRPAVKVTMVVQ